MRNLLILAVAASFAVACGASRTEDEVGAAPEGADTTAVISDTSAVFADTAQTYPADTTMGQLPSDTDTSYVQQDTPADDPTMTTDSIGPQGEVQTGDTTAADTWTDTTADTTATMHGDSAMTDHAVPDTTTPQ